MNIVYSQFSDIGEYFDATKGARDFDAAPRGMTGDTSFIQKVVETVKAIPGNIANETSRRLEAKDEPKWTDPIHTTDYVAKRKDVWEAQDKMMKPVAEYNKAVESVPEAVRQSSDSVQGPLPEGFDPTRITTPATPSISDWLGDINPGDGVLSNAEILTGAGVGTAAALALGLGVKKHLKNKKELKKAQEYFREHPRAKKAAGFSEEKDFDVELRGKDIDRFRAAKTNLIINEAFFPSRKAKKFKFDVERQIKANKLAESNPDIARELEQIDARNREGNNYLTAAWYGNTGAAYHTPKDAVQALNRILDSADEEDFSEPSTGQRIAFHLAGLFPKKNTGNAKNQYWDAVNAVAKLPKEEREKIYDDINSMHGGRAVADWVAAAIPYGSYANVIYQDATVSGKYKNIAKEANIQSKLIESSDKPQK